MVYFCKPLQIFKTVKLSICFQPSEIPIWMFHIHEKLMDLFLQSMLKKSGGGEITDILG